MNQDLENSRVFQDNYQGGLLKWSPQTLVYIPSHSQYRTNIQGQLTVFLESAAETASGDECEHRQHARTHPMTDTNISTFVVATVGYENNNQIRVLLGDSTVGFGGRDPLT